MLLTRRGSRLLVVVGVLVGLLMTACSGEDTRSSSAATPTVPLNATPSVASPSPTKPSAPATPAPSPTTPTQQPISWVGPLLYPPWYLHFEQAGLPIYDLGAGQTRWLQTSERVYEVLDWSPDGCQVAYLARGEDQSEDRVRVVHLYTLEDRAIFSGPHRSWGWVRLDWSPTGKWIALSPKEPGPEFHEEIYLVRPSGGERKRLTTHKDVALPSGWLAGGQEVLYWSFFPSQRAQAEPWEGIWQLNMVNIDSMEERAVARYSQPLESWEDLVITDVRTLQPLRLAGFAQPGDVHFVDLYWTPDLNHFLVITARDAPEGSEALVGVNMYVLDVLRREVRKPNSGEFELIGFGSQSMDGLLFAFVGQYFDEASAEDPRTYVLDVAVGEVKVLGQGEGVVLQAPNWSPDNTMLSFIERYQGTALGSGSYVYHLSTGEVTRLPDIFFNSGPGWSVGWSPRALYGRDACPDSR